MIEFLYNFTAKIKEKNCFFGKIIYKISKLIINFFYPVFHFFDKKYGLDDNSNIIISITSFPKRINTVWITIATLLNQKKIKPRKIVLWLAQEQFCNCRLPYKLTRLCKRGLEIRFCDDLKSHKKYYYTMKEFGNEYFIITCDDDIFYPENLVEGLINGSRKHPNVVICNWAHKITFDNEYQFNKYSLWTNSKNELGIDIIPIGCCGVLYPPKCINREVFNKEKIEHVSLYTDDLWLKCMEVKENILAINVNQNDIIFFNNIRNQFSGLWKKNTQGLSRNDIVWEKLMLSYPDVRDKIIIVTKGEQN